MYSRKLEEQILTFGHEGVLYNFSFIMYDKQSNSKWVHVTGKAIKGHYRGQELTFLPSRITTWKQWKIAYPKTTVLMGKKAIGFMGTYTARWKTENFGLIVSTIETRLYPYSILNKQTILHDFLGKVAILIAYNSTDSSVSAFQRNVGKTILEFSKFKDSKGKFSIQDKSTHSIWNGLTGKCMEGKWKGNQLQQIPATPILMERYRAFYPSGTIYRTKK